MPGMAENQCEQPDDPGDAGFILEAYHEAGEVDLGLMSRCGLKSDLERLRPIARSDRRDKALHSCVSAGITPLTELARQPRGGQFREGGQPLAEVIEIGRQLVRASNLPCSISWQLKPSFNIFANRLRVAARTPRNRGHGQSLA